MRRSLLVLGLALALTATPGGAAGTALVPVLVIEGHGWGHGVGMAQDGAYWMGRAGASTPRILAQFYPGTRLGRAGGEVRVTVHASGAGEAVVAFPAGGEVRDAREGGRAPGFPVQVPPGGRARLRFDGRRYSAELLAGGAARPSAARGAVLTASARPARGAQEPPPTTTTLTLPDPGTTPLPDPTGPGGPPPPSTTVVPPPSPPPPAAPPPAVPAPAPPAAASSSRPLWAVPAGSGTLDVPARARRYRGVLEAAAGPAGLRLVNHLDVEQYLRGMGEVLDPGWPPAALRAQAVAARTYALRAMAGGGELCDHQQCQVYLGVQAEYAAMDRAVAQTRGQVVVFRKALASTVYSANGGGFSASTEEGFGTGDEDFPYLRPAPYPTKDPFPWVARVALRDVAARLGYRGKLHAVRTEAGPSGRVLRVTLEGSRGARTVSGIEFDHALALRSTKFTMRVETAEAPPPPPPPERGGVQALPDEAGAGAGTAGDPGGVVAAPGDGRHPPAAAPAGGVVSVRPAEAVALGALAWLLLLAVTGGAAAVRLGRSPRRRSPAAAAPVPAPERATAPVPEPGTRAAGAPGTETP